MKVVLVNPPHSEYDLNEIGPPLGLLRLASIARASGWDVEIVDLNLLTHIDANLRTRFYERALELITEASGDLYGFTSMCVDSHVALELARRIKIQAPTAKVVLGGTHFSSIRDAVTQSCQWIDSVVTGEGESAFRQMLSGDHPVGMPTLATSDYALVDIGPYFALNPYRSIDVESARGCRFRCAFCYSPSHYPQRRTLDLDRLLQELAFLEDRGARHVHFVEDNWLNDEERALTLCSALAEAKLGLTWHCYATLPQINQRIVAAMAAAGCRAVFVGVDAIGKMSERTYGKRFSSGADEKIRLCMDYGVRPTCAYLLAPPSHPCGRDVEETLSGALAARALGALVRLNILTYYSGTRIAQAGKVAFAHDETKVELTMDVPDVVARNQYAAEHPELFPFHSRYVSAEEWRGFVQQIHVLFTLLHARTDQLIEMHASTGGLIEVARGVLDQTGDLTAIHKRRRRQAEVDVFDQLRERTLVEA